MSNFTARVVRYQLAEQVTIYVRHQLAEICQPSAVGSQLGTGFGLNNANQVELLNLRLITIRRAA